MKFKDLLALDSGPGYLWDLYLVYPDIPIEFSPDTTISLSQLLNQGIFITLKSY
jgi:hypothetical protein